MKKIILSLILILYLFTSAVTATEYNEVIDIGTGKAIATPLCYKFLRSYNYLGEKYGSLSNPNDIFIDAQENIFIADTENNRIIKLSQDGIVLKVFTLGGGTSFENPQGVFVNNDGNIYVADTENNRIALLDKNGKFIKSIVKPNSELLGDDFIFNPRKVAVSSIGNIYVIKQQWLMAIGDNNSFRGYVGATKAKKDILNFISELFMNNVQKLIRNKPKPPSIINFTLTDQDEIFVTTFDNENGQLKELNILGKNIYPKTSAFGQNLKNEQGKATNPIFVDVAIDKNSNAFLLDSVFGRVYVYDSQGNNIAIFGGSGYGKGALALPEAIDVDSTGKVYIVDKELNEVLVYEPTHFMQMVFEANKAYDNGNYETSVDIWRDVGKMDANYYLANVSIAKSYFKNGQWEKSMEYYKLIDDKAGYSQALNQIRNDFYKKSFVFVFIAIIFSVILILYLLILYRKFSINMLDKFK
jgi:hypothetical protein